MTGRRMCLVSCNPNRSAPVCWFRPSLPLEQGLLHLVDPSSDSGSSRKQAAVVSSRSEASGNTSVYTVMMLSAWHRGSAWQ